MQKWRGGRGREKRKTAEHFSTTLRSNFVTSKNLFFFPFFLHSLRGPLASPLFDFCKLANEGDDLLCIRKRAHCPGAVESRIESLFFLSSSASSRRQRRRIVPEKPNNFDLPRQRRRSFVPPRLHRHLRHRHQHQQQQQQQQQQQRRLRCRSRLQEERRRRRRAGRRRGGREDRGGQPREAREAPLRQRAQGDLAPGARLRLQAAQDRLGGLAAAEEIASL